VYAPPARQERIPAAIASLATVAAVGWVMLAGLNVSQVMRAVEPLISVDFANPPPKPPTPPREKPKPVKRSAARHKASPRNLRNQATAIVAPPIPFVIKPPPPVIAAPKPGPGLAANNGASDRAGPGQGAGGVGDGRGGGGDGGDGDGDVPPEQVGGHLSFNDIPRGIVQAGRGGTVGVRYYVNPDGRVSGCSVTATSGIAELDTVTCRLIEQRFRFRPSRDGDGHPVRSVIVESHRWSIDRSAMQKDEG
jgi:protein TonB